MQIQEIQKKLPLIIAVACGILAIALLNIYLKQRESEIWTKIKQVQQQTKPPVQPQQPQPQMAIALVAQRDIPAQAPISASDVGIKEIPKEYIQPGAVVSLEEVIGQIASVEIAAGEQILKTKLLPPAKVKKTLSEITPEGKRAVVVSVDNTSSVVGLIQPGNYVDVFALISPPAGVGKAGVTPTGSNLVPLFQNVKVLTVGTEFSQVQMKEPAKGASPSAVGTVTLALSPKEAVLLSFVQEHGKIKLALRSSGDTRVEQIDSADWDTLFQYLYPPKESISQEPVVEIYRGLQKETVPLSKQ